ncbi:LysR family transcriptional regulator [Zhihengliuella halotolerans]|uniref:LysR family transcriptional regulator n=1 Tax=Zhihengliuella halotolerans TaxID=370736 RepID=UPI000C7FF62F|nr:LysR family transcriptional regulator [Zhihengliuella halotolerans]
MLEAGALRYLVAIADAGSVSIAAERSFVTQPAISRRIAQLERQLGLKLFRRTPNGMVPTPAGERLIGMARDVLTRLDRAESVMRALADQRRDFVIACPVTSGDFYVAPYMAAGGAVSGIMSAPPDEAFTLLAHGADLALSTFAPPAHLRSRRIVGIPIHCHALPDPGAEAPPTVELEEVVRRPFVLPGHASAITHGVRRAAEADGIRLDLAQIADNGHLAQARAAGGHAAALVIEEPAFGLEERVLLHNGEPIVVDLFAAWEADHYAEAAIAELVEDFAGFAVARVGPRNAELFGGLSSGG